MTNTLRNMPRYIRNTDAFGWQGADNPDGSWRSITPPQSGTPWQTTSVMNDLTPNDLSHLSEAEFQALCPQGEHAPGPEPLSPAARAVRDAALATYDESIPKDDNLWALDRASVVAALRAAADQVVPEPSYRSPTAASVDRAAWVIRGQFLAIADELEGAR